MTVIFGQPTTGQPFGPGIQFSVRSDLVGPVAGAQWNVSWSLVSGAVGPYQHSFVPADFHVLSLQTFMFVPGSPLVLPDMRSNFLAASSGFLVAQLLDGSFTLVEQGQVAITLEFRGYTVLLSHQLASGIVAGQGSADFAAIKAAVVKTFAF